MLARLCGQTDSIVDNPGIHIQISQIDILIGASLVLHACGIVKVDGKAGVVVDFEHPWLQILIDEHVQPKYFKRLAPELHLVRYLGHLMLKKRRVDMHELAHHILYPILDLIDIYATLILLQSVVERLKSAFGSLIVEKNLIVGRILVLRIRLIDAIVGQVHVNFSVIFLRRCLIFRLLE